MDHQLLLCFDCRIDWGAVILLELHSHPSHLEEISWIRLIQFDGVRDLEVGAAIGDLDAGGVGAGLAGGDAAALGDRLLGVEVHRVDDVPLLDAAPQVAAVHLRAIPVERRADQILVQEAKREQRLGG